MLWKILLMVVVIAIAVGLVVQHAVTNTQIHTIADVKSSRIGDGVVALKGTIIFAQDNKFILDDGSGKVELSTCPVWYKRINLHQNDRVTVVGQVMQNPSFSADCDFVLSVFKIMHGKDVVHVRRHAGKPPWLSQPSPAGSTRF